MKKLLSLLLVMCMVLVLFPAAASADGNSDQRTVLVIVNPDVLSADVAAQLVPADLDTMLRVVGTVTVCPETAELLLDKAGSIGTSAPETVVVGAVLVNTTAGATAVTTLANGETLALAGHAVVEDLGEAQFAKVNGSNLPLMQYGFVKDSAGDVRFYSTVDWSEQGLKRGRMVTAADLYIYWQTYSFDQNGYQTGVLAGDHTAAPYSKTNYPNGLPATGASNTFVHVHNFDYAHPLYSAKAGCTTDGYIVYRCTLCNATCTQILPAIGHDWGAPSYTWSKDLSKVTATHVCRIDKNHSESETVKTVLTVTKAPTATTTGLGVYTSEKFKNSAFRQQSMTVVLPTTNWGTPIYTWAADYSSVTAKRVNNSDSKYVETETVTPTAVVTNATCTTKGKTVYTATFSNSAFATQTKEVAIPALGHTLLAHTAVAATCEKAGSIAYWSCDTCGKLFKDEDGTTAIEESDTVVAATGHSWGAVTYTWTVNDDGTAAIVASQVCENDSTHIRSEAGTVSYSVTTPATSDSKGVGTYSAVFTNPEYTIQTMDVELPALTDIWTAAVYTWSDNNSSVTASRSKIDDETAVQSEEVNSSFVSTPATCTEEGTTVYTAVFSNSAFTTQTKTVKTADALGHDWELVSSDANGDHYTCKHCGCKKVEEPSSLMMVYSMASADAADGVVSAPEADAQAEGTDVSEAPEAEEQANTAKEENVAESAEQVSELNGSVESADIADEQGQEEKKAPTENSDNAESEENAAPEESTSEEPVADVQTSAEESTSEDAADEAVSGASSPDENTDAALVLTDPVGAEEDTADNAAPQNNAEFIPEWAEPAYVWADNCSRVTATKVCRNDGNLTISETVNTVAEIKDGQVTYTAVFTNSVFTTQTRTVPLTVSDYEPDSQSETEEKTASDAASQEQTGDNSITDTPDESAEETGEFGAAEITAESSDSGDHAEPPEEEPGACSEAEATDSASAEAVQSSEISAVNLAAEENGAADCASSGAAEAAAPSAQETAPLEVVSSPSAPEVTTTAPATVQPSVSAGKRTVPLQQTNVGNDSLLFDEFGNPILSESEESA
ncbi:MAG: hypothetical protein K6C08_12105 [Oscillospiraceae bacterium]|nr:hypothetical protein [Oscillospiraceae bacterium]